MIAHRLANTEIKWATKLRNITPAKQYQEFIRKFVQFALARFGTIFSIKPKEIPMHRRQ